MHWANASAKCTWAAEGAAGPTSSFGSYFWQDLYALWNVGELELIELIDYGPPLLLGPG
jgi:hypothetical protein